MTPTRRRLAIAVGPRLLSDLLSRALARDDREIVVVQTPSPAHPERTGEGHPDFDIALVSVGTQHVAASVVIRLAETPAPGVAHVGVESVPVGDLEALVALVDRCSAALEQARAIPGV